MRLRAAASWSAGKQLEKRLQLKLATGQKRD